MTIRDRAQAALDRASVATAGPWGADGWEDGNEGEGHPVWTLGCWVKDGDAPTRFIGRAAVTERDADAQFIAAARADVPDLSAALLRILSPETFSQIAKTLYGGGGLTAGEAGAKADDVMRLIERIAEGERR